MIMPSSKYYKRVTDSSPTSVATPIDGAHFPYDGASYSAGRE
jgi:hypothetical protein